MEMLRRVEMYLHQTRYGHFGIAVVEAMVAGLVPVVHRGGGPWTDIVELSKYRLGYKSIEELMEQITSVISNRGIWTESALKVSQKAKQYS